MFGKYFVSYAQEVTFDSLEKLDKQTEATFSKNVKFDAFFKEDGKNTHYKLADINKDNTEIEFNIEVQKEGYLKNATISVQAENEDIPLNYEIVSIDDEMQVVQKMTENMLYLRQINRDESVNFKLNILPKIDDTISIDALNQNSKIAIKATYVDAKGKEVSIEKEITLNISWTGDYEIENELELVKYIPLDINDEKKVFVQYNLKTGFVEQENMLPIKNTAIELQIPDLNGIKPEKIDVVAKSTKATNNKTADKVEFTNENWNINEQEGTIKIKVDNKQTEEGIIEIGNGKDEYLITYVYTERAYNSINSSTKVSNLNTKIKTQIEIYGDIEEKKFIKEETKSTALQEPVGKLTSLDGIAKTKNIGKGKMYANTKSQQKINETEFETVWQINVAYKDNLEQIILQDGIISASNSNGLTYKINDYAIYKQTTINRASFLQVLGEEGYMQIRNKDGLVIGIISEGSNLDENGDYVMTYYGDFTRNKYRNK